MRFSNRCTARGKLALRARSIIRLGQNNLFFQHSDGGPQGRFEHFTLPIVQTFRGVTVTDVTAKAQHLLVVNFP